MPKTYILDTNVLLHNPRALFVFEENSVVIPLAVIEEIDSQKRRQDEIGRNARIVSRILDSLRMNGQLSSGVLLPNGGALRVEVNHQEAIDFPRGLDSRKRRFQATSPWSKGRDRNWRNSQPGCCKLLQRAPDGYAAAE